MAIRHYYMAHLSEELNADLVDIKGNADLVDIKGLLDGIGENHPSRKALIAIYLRKKVELENFNRKQQKELFEFNAEEEIRKIEEDRKVFEEHKTYLQGKDLADIENKIEFMNKRQAKLLASIPWMDRTSITIFKKCLGSVDASWGTMIHNMMPPVLLSQLAPTLGGGFALVAFVDGVIENAKNTKHAYEKLNELSPEEDKDLDKKQIYGHRLRFSAANLSLTSIGLLGSIALIVVGSLILTGAAIAIGTLFTLGLIPGAAFLGSMTNRMLTQHENEKYIKSRLALAEKIPNNKQVIFKYQQKIRELEAKKVFCRFELAGSTIATTGFIGIILTVLGVVSWGMIPAGIMITGALIGVGTLVFEKIDEKNNFKYSNKIRNFFSGEEKTEVKKNDLSNELELCRHPNKTKLSLKMLNQVYNSLTTSAEKKIFRQEAWKKIQESIKDLAKSDRAPYLEKVKNSYLFSSNRNKLSFFQPKTARMIDEAIVTHRKYSVLGG